MSYSVLIMSMQAFHKPCLAYSAWAQDFVCPRHKCVVCHASEADLVKAAKR